VLDESGSYSPSTTNLSPRALVDVTANYTAAYQDIFRRGGRECGERQRKRLIDRAYAGVVDATVRETLRDRVRSRASTSPTTAAIASPRKRASRWRRRLIAYFRNHSVTIDARNILRGEDLHHAGCAVNTVSDLRTEIVLARRTADRAHAKSAGGSFVCTEDFRASTFFLSIESHQACAYCSARTGCICSPTLPTSEIARIILR